MSDETHRQQISEDELQAWADGRVPEDRRAAVDDWLAAHPDDAERLAAYRAINEQLRSRYGAVLQEPVPEGLAAAASRAPRRRGLALAAAWAVLGVGIGVIAGWELHSLRVGPPAAKLEAPLLARRAAIAHATYSPEVRHPVEVGADQEQHLVAWLSKRLGAPLRAPKLDTEGMSLVGGRLLPGEAGPVAQFMYQCARGRRVTLYVRTEAPEHAETAFRYARENGVRVFYWIDRDLGYALSSADLERDELLKLANAAYRQLNP